MLIFQIASHQCSMHIRYGKLHWCGNIKKINDEDYSKGFGQIKEASEALTEDDIFQSYISDQDFRSSNEANGFGFTLYVLDIRHKENFTAPQPSKVGIKLNGFGPNDIIFNALVLTITLISIGSDRQWHFDLFWSLWVA